MSSRWQHKHQLHSSLLLIPSPFVWLPHIWQEKDIYFLLHLSVILPFNSPLVAVNFAFLFFFHQISQNLFLLRHQLRPAQLSLVNRLWSLFAEGNTDFDFYYIWHHFGKQGENVTANETERKLWRHSTGASWYVFVALIEFVLTIIGYSDPHKSSGNGSSAICMTNKSSLAFRAITFRSLRFRRVVQINI